MSSQLFDETELLKKKKQAIEEFLKHEHLFIHINPHDEGVIIPSYLKQESTTTLKLSYYFRGALELGEDTITTELLFGQEYFSCTIPYRSIWGATNFQGENIIWPEATPKEILAQLIEQSEAAKGEEKKEPTPTRKNTVRTKGHLKRVK